MASHVIGLHWQNTTSLLVSVQISQQGCDPDGDPSDDQVGVDPLHFVKPYQT